MAFLILLIAIGVLVTAFVKPKWGTYIVWFVLFTYPHGWWFRNNFLPLNIGFDDLFCLTLFFMVLIRRNILGGVPVRFGYAFWVISCFVLVASVANMSGLSETLGVERIAIIKSILKLGVNWGLFYAILHCIDDERDLKIQLVMFSLAAMAAALIIILQHFFPYQMEIFARPTMAGAEAVSFEKRLAGALMNSNTAACVMACSSMLVIAAIRLQRTIISKAIIYGLVFLLLTAALLTKSRAGWLAIGSTLILMAVFSRGRIVAWFVIIAALIVIMQLEVIRANFIERIREAYDPSTGVVGKNVAGRIRTWKVYLSTAGPKEYLLGQGFKRGIARHGQESHNVYISLLAVYGIGGVVWAVVALIVFFRKASGLKHFPDPLFAVISAGCTWALVAWGIYGLTADALNAMYARYLLFYLVILVDRSYAVAIQQQWLLYEEEADQPIMYLEEATVY